MLRAVDAKAYNDALAATNYYKKDQRMHIPWWHLPLKNHWSFEGWDYQKLCDLDKKTSPALALDSTKEKD